MGIFSWFADKLDDAKAAVCGAVEAIKERVAECTEAVAERGAKVWSSFTGKGDFDEANRHYAKLRERWEAASTEFHAYAGQAVEKAGALLRHINDQKRALYEQHFPRFVELAGSFAHWDVGVSLSLDGQMTVPKGPGTIRSWGELFSIDFDDRPARSYLKALVSGGFWSRKEAKESLLKVREEEERLEHEIATLASEKERLDAVVASLAQVRDYFAELSAIYLRVLDQLQYAVGMLSTLYHLRQPSYAGEAMDCYFLPKQHLLCLMGADKLTRVLHRMCALRYVDARADLTLLDSDKGELVEAHQQAQETGRRALAA